EIVDDVDRRRAGIAERRRDGMGLVNEAALDVVAALHQDAAELGGEAYVAWPERERLAQRLVGGLVVAERQAAQPGIELQGLHVVRVILQDTFVGLPGLLEPAEAALEGAAQAQIGDVAGVERERALDVALGLRDAREIVERHGAIMEGLGLAGVHHDGAAESGQPLLALAGL